MCCRFIPQLEVLRLAGNKLTSQPLYCVYTAGLPLVEVYEVGREKIDQPASVLCALQVYPEWRS